MDGPAVSASVCGHVFPLLPGQSAFSGEQHINLTDVVVILLLVHIISICILILIVDSGGVSIISFFYFHLYNSYYKGQ